MTKIQYFFEETGKHIRNVQLTMHNMITELLHRSRLHDQSKYDASEFESFVEISPELSRVTYGSDEYKENLRKIKPAIIHHNSVNSHHPEHYPNGISGMDLIDLLEMMADWLAASKRNPKGDILDSIEKNQERFGYSDELKSILKNTARHYLIDLELMEPHFKYVE